MPDIENPQISGIQVAIAYEKERAGRMAAVRLEKELKNQILIGNLVSIEDVDIQVTTMLTMVKTKILSIPSKATNLLFEKGLIEEEAGRGGSCAY